MSILPRKARVKIRKWMFSMFFHIPSFIRSPISRRLLNITHNYPDNFVVKLAETEDEHKQALSVLYSAYLDRRLIQENNGAIRATKFQALPQTSIVIAKLGNEVIGTLSHVRDSSSGLPIDEVIDVTELRDNHLRIGEVTAFAIKRSHQKNKMETMIPLFRFLFHYCREYLGIEVFIMASHPRVSSLYSDLLGFKNIAGEVYQYKSLGRAKAYAQYVVFADVIPWVQKTYSGVPIHRNINEAVLGPLLDKYCRFPKRNFYKASDFNMSPKSLDEFFNSQTDLFKSLSNKDKQLLRESYHFPSYANIVPEPEDEYLNLVKRKNKRFSVNCPVRIIDTSSNTTLIQIKEGVVFDASSEGFMIHSSIPLSKNKNYSFKIEVGPNKSTHIEAVCTWEKSNNIYGLKIISQKDSVWQEFIGYLSEEFGCDRQIEHELKKSV